MQSDRILIKLTAAYFVYFIFLFLFMSLFCFTSKCVRFSKSFDILWMGNKLTKDEKFTLEKQRNANILAYSRITHIESSKFVCLHSRSIDARGEKRISFYGFMYVKSPSFGTFFFLYLHHSLHHFIHIQLPSTQTHRSIYMILLFEQCFSSEWWICILIEFKIHTSIDGENNETFIEEYCKIIVIKCA